MSRTLELGGRFGEEIITLRRALHQVPEYDLDLPKTQGLILQALEGLDLEITLGKELSSVTAVLRGGAGPGPVVLLRGDMDALPLQEDSGLAFASETPGSMHACGHDTHTAMLASAARLLHSRRDALAGKVVFMFQPGEEGHHGARQMIDEGVLAAAGEPARAFALHITSTAPSGMVCCRPGALMAAADSFGVTVTGRGGHGAMPEDAIDPVPAAAAMVGALYTMLTRRIGVFDPALLTVGRIGAGTTTNIIPETAEIEGTVRTMSEETRRRLHEEIATVCSNIGAAFGCTVAVDIRHGYPATINDEAVAGRVLDVAGSVLGVRHGALMANPLMASEDFSYILQRVPGALAFLGACPPGVEPEQAPPNHSNRVHFDESALAHGVATYAAFALDALR
jgi:amidohydrolase